MDSPLLSITQTSPKLRVYQNIAISFFIWLLLEGIIRKWIFSSGATALFFTKYAIWGLANVYLLIDSQSRSGVRLPFIRWIVMYLIWGAFTFFTGGINYNFLVSILGIMIHFWFITIPFILPLLITSSQQLNRLLHVCMYVSIITSIVGVVQYFSPLDSFINRYALEEDALLIASSGENVRIISIFSYLSIYSTFLNFMILVAFVKVLDVKKLNRNNIVAIVALGLSLVSAFMTGSRGIIFVAGLQCLLIALIITFTTSSGNKVIMYLLRFLLMGGLAYLIITQTSIGSAAFGSWMQRVEDVGTDEAGNRLLYIFTPFKNAEKTGIISALAGFGLGTTYQGATALVKDWGTMPRYFEAEPERIVLEIGIIGFLITTGLRISIFVFALKVYRMQQDIFLKRLSLMITIYLLPTVVGLSSIIFNWMDNVIYWTLVGVLASLYQISTRYQETELFYRLNKMQEAFRREQLSS